MNFEDEQDLLILSKIYNIKKEDNNPAKEFQNIFKETFGNGWGVIYEKFRFKVYIKNALKNNEKITNEAIIYTSDIGIAKYLKLKREKRSESLYKVIGWVTVAAAVLSAVYAILTYYDVGKTSIEPKSKSDSNRVQPVILLPQTLTPDTIKAQDTPLKLSDSVHKKHS